MNINLWAGAFLNWVYNDVITHFPVHFIRLGFLRVFNKNIDSSAKILMHTKILNFWKISIGPRTVVNQYCLLDCRSYKIYLENDVDIGPYTRIWTLGHDPDDDLHVIKGGDVIIKDHVWIASGVTVLPKVEIGRGAVVAASSVITKSIDELSIVGGNPAKVIRKRRNALSYRLNFTPIFN